MGAHGGPSEPVAACTFLEAKKKSKKPGRFATFFWPAGLGLGSGWVCHFKSKGFVQVGREFFQKLVFRVDGKVCFGMLHDSLVRIVPKVPRAAGGSPAPGSPRKVGRWLLTSSKSMKNIEFS